MDRVEAEKYEFIHESCVFSLLFFQPNKFESQMIRQSPTLCGYAHNCNGCDFGFNCHEAYLN